MGLLEEEIITEEVLSVPREEWDIGDEIAALCDGSTPVARYILKPMKQGVGIIAVTKISV